MLPKGRQILYGLNLHEPEGGNDGHLSVNFSFDRFFPIRHSEFSVLGSKIQRTEVSAILTD